MRISDWSSDVCSSDLSGASGQCVANVLLSPPDCRGWAVRVECPTMRRKWCAKSQEGLDPPVPRHHFRGDESGWWAARALDRCKGSVGQPPGAQDGCCVLALPGYMAHWQAPISPPENQLQWRPWPQ